MCALEPRHGHKLTKVASLETKASPLARAMYLGVFNILLIESIRVFLLLEAGLLVSDKGGEVQQAALSRPSVVKTSSFQKTFI